MVDYITHNTDKNARGCERFVIHVESPKSVNLYTEMDPESAFVFRVKSEERNGVAMALFEADGSAWKHTAVVEIKDFFQKSLEDDVVILA